MPKARDRAVSPAAPLPSPLDAPRPATAGSRLLIVLILLFVALVYSQSLDSPFHFDDDHYILRNEPIRNLSNWTSWPWKRYQYRVLFELSLGANMKLGGMNPWGYHAFNVAGHLLAVLAVYVLTSQIVRRTRYEERTRYLPEAAALLFGLHPLASQPVLYVMARNNGWAAMLMLWATVLAIRGHDSWLSAKRRAAAAWFLGALALWIASLLFKQTTAVWPFLLVLLWVFRHGLPRRRVTWTLIALTLGLCVAGIIVGWRTNILARNNIRLDFLATQFVIWLNVWRRVVLPFSMNSEHDFPVYDSFGHWQVIGAMGLSIAFVVLAMFWISRRRLAGLGALWAYITLLPTNSILYRPDYLSDRNVYLFVLGGVWVLADAAVYAAQALSAAGRKFALRAAFVLFVLLCTVLAGYQVWIYRDRTRLLEDALSRSPHQMRVLINLGQEYEYAGRMAEAQQMYTRCVENWEQGRGMQFPQRNQWASMALNNLGKSAAEKQSTEAQGDAAARPYFERALKIDRTNPLALDNLAIILLEHRDYPALLDISLHVKSTSSALLYRGCAYAGLHQTRNAARYLKRALDPVACRRVSPRLRVTALQALASMSSAPRMNELAEQAKQELTVLRRSQNPSSPAGRNQ